MPQDMLVRVLQHGGGLSQVEAVDRVRECREGGTYQEDIFTA